MNRRAGFTLIELLVASAVFAVLLTIVGAFFAQQVRVAELSRSINEAEALARTVAESVLQDMQLAGSRVISATGLPIPSIGDNCTEPARDGCIDVFAATDGALHFAAYYGTTIDQGGPCRRVDYAWSSATGMLDRSDIAIICNDAGSADLAPFAANVSRLRIEYLCSDGRTPPPRVAAGCYVGDAYVRQAEVFVEVTLERRQRIVRGVTMVAAMPNLRPGVDYLRDIPDD